MRINIILCLSVLAVVHCSGKSDGAAAAGGTSGGPTTLTVQVTGATANRAISLRVSNESTRRTVTGFNFDFTPTGDKADAAGNYSKTVTGLASGTNYTIVVRSDVNNNNEQDTNDTGQVVIGIQPGATATFNNLQTLSTLGANASTDAVLANKAAGCTIGKQDYQSGDLTAGTTIGYVGAVAIIYNGSGVPTVSTAHFPPGTYNTVMCAIDMNGNETMDAGDRYQFIAGPINLPAGNDSTTFTLGAWSTY
jgi:uncharacterized protein (DUF2141 family)